MFHRAARLWEHNRATAAERRSALERRIRSLRKEEEKFLDRIVETDNQSVVAAYEKRIAKVQHEEAAVKEKLAQIDAEPADFDEMFKHTVDILSRPWEVWKKHDYEWKQAIIKVVFADKLRYSHESGLQTPETTFVFKVLRGEERAKNNLADGTGLASNVLPLKH